MSVNVPPCPFVSLYVSLVRIIFPKLRKKFGRGIMRAMKTVTYAVPRDVLEPALEKADEFISIAPIVGPGILAGFGLDEDAAEGMLSGEVLEFARAFVGAVYGASTVTVLVDGEPAVQLTVDGDAAVALTIGEDVENENDVVTDAVVESARAVTRIAEAPANETAGHHAMAALAEGIIRCTETLQRDETTPEEAITEGVLMAANVRDMVWGMWGPTAALGLQIDTEATRLDAITRYVPPTRDATLTGAPEDRIDEAYRRTVEAVMSGEEESAGVVVRAPKKPRGRR